MKFIPADRSNSAGYDRFRRIKGDPCNRYVPLYSKNRFRGKVTTFVHNPYISTQDEYVNQNLLYSRMKKSIVYAILLVALMTSCATRKNLRDISVETLVKSSQSWNGAELPGYGEGIPEVTVLRITIPPGASLQPHKHLCINVGLLTKGELTVMTETDQKMVLKAGDPIVELVNTWHYGKNTGRKPAEIVVFYAGVIDQPITVLQEKN